MAIAKNATMTQIPILDIDSSCGRNKPALDDTIAMINPNTIIFMIATIRIFGGYFPGYLPPIEASPQGNPAAKHP